MSSSNVPSQNQHPKESNMKANNGKGNNESRDTWETPKWLFDILNKQYRFTFDCCTSPLNRKTQNYSDNFQREDYYGAKKAWMNPPFSKAYIMFKRFIKLSYSGVAIYRCDNPETKIWQQIIFPNCSWIFIPDKRIAYEGMEGNGSRFPSALIGFKVEKPTGLQGTILDIPQQ